MVKLSFPFTVYRYLHCSQDDRALVVPDRCQAGADSRAWAVVAAVQAGVDSRALAEEDSQAWTAVATVVLVAAESRLLEAELRQIVEDAAALVADLVAGARLGMPDLVARHSRLDSCQALVLHMGHQPLPAEVACQIARTCLEQRYRVAAAVDQVVHKLLVLTELLVVAAAQRRWMLVAAVVQLVLVVACVANPPNWRC